VEQPIGPKVPPTHAAGFDPASVPGLLPPRRPADAAPAPEAVADEVEDAPEPEAAGTGTGKSLAEPAAAQSDNDASPAADDDSAADAADAEDAEDAEDTDAAEDAAEDDGKPVFEVSDRRGAIAADRSGVTFRLDGEVAEFGWDEIQAVEIDTPRFGRRFSVTVYTSTRRWFQSDVEAPSRGELKSWTAQLDAVLDARFEEGGEPEATAEAVVPAQVADTEQVAETAEDAVEDAAEDSDADATAKGAQANA
jgi:hypothetical protein